MDRNVRIARQLVKLAKSLVAVENKHLFNYNGKIVGQDDVESVVEDLFDQNDVMTIRVTGFVQIDNDYDENIISVLKGAGADDYRKGDDLLRLFQNKFSDVNVTDVFFKTVEYELEDGSYYIIDVKN